MGQRLAILCTLLLLPHILADGMAFKGRDYSSFVPARENQQLAFIDCRDGQQRMIVSISLPLDDDESAVWILPVPGEPQHVQADLTDVFPRLKGHDPFVQMRSRIALCFDVALLTQIYPIIPMSCLLPSLSRDATAAAVQEVDKFGLRTQVVLAKSLAALVRHLNEQGLSLTEQSLASFSPYFDPPHTFVVTWVKSWRQVREEFSDIEQMVNERQPSVVVEFPATQAFFPMRATSGYGSERLEVRLYIAGFVRLRTAAALADPPQTRYYRDARHPTAPQSVRPFDYTRFEATVNSADLSDDFRFEAFNPPGIRLATIVERIAESKPAAGAVIFGLIAVFSCISGAITSRLMIQKWTPGALLGLGNVLTLLAVYYLSRDVKSTDAQRLRDARLVGMRFWLVFSLVFVTIVLVLRNITLWIIPSSE